MQYLIETAKRPIRPLEQRALEPRLAYHAPVKHLTENIEVGYATIPALTTTYNRGPIGAATSAARCKYRLFTFKLRVNSPVLRLALAKVVLMLHASPVEIDDGH